MTELQIDGSTIPCHTVDTLVIGSGCAGFNAADTLRDLGGQVAMLTEGVHCGTSRNTGSDKQTYYKLSLCSDTPDSVYALAKNLFDGGSVNGDTALIEAAGSVRCFMKLVNLGVPFPTNRYGEYVGYKTDHDPLQRATSCGPLTSRVMTERLEQSVRSKHIAIHDRMQVIRLLVEDGAVMGVVALDLTKTEQLNHGITLFMANNVILATGGPAIAYRDSVYPAGQTGMTGLALAAGAVGCNLQEWQYGLASIQFRWNVSGTYQQVLPRYIAVDRQGHQREFLPEYFDTPAQALERVFLKGYQWPFDTNKIDGSSLIDMIVYHETVQRGNRVYLDFRENPQGIRSDFSGLFAEAFDYLKQSNALGGTPVERLELMNPQAAALYAKHGIDLHIDPLEIAVCAQHCNGGLAVDADWQTTIRGLYCVGEAAGTFGITRPGGSALNSTQVGSLRAAEHIVWQKAQPRSRADGLAVQRAVGAVLAEVQALSSHSGGSGMQEQRLLLQSAMSETAAHVRTLGGLSQLAELLDNQVASFFQQGSAPDGQLAQAYKNYDMLLVQRAMVSAMTLTARSCKSRGSALLLEPGGVPVSTKIPDCCYAAGTGSHRDQLVLTRVDNDGTTSEFVPVRPLPHTHDWFENTWNDYCAARERTVTKEGVV